MTILLDNSAPRIDEPRIIKTKPVLFTPALLLAIAASVITFLNVSAVVYAYRSTNDLIEIEQRLGELKAFEDRIVARMDAMNNGIQRRLEMLQGDVQGQLGGLRSEAGKAASPDLEVPATEIETGALEPDAETSAETVEGSGTMAAEVSLPTRAASPPPQKSSSYERIQSPDGKVYYRKMR